MKTTMEQRIIKFKRYYRHYKTEEVTSKEWGCLSMGGQVITDFSSFSAPSFISNYKAFADCQFTGLFDKEGVEIYDKDLVEDDKYIYLVEYSIQNSSWRIYPKVNKDGTPVGIVDMIDWQVLGNGYYRRDDLKVIGSIYTHPQLLEK